MIHEIPVASIFSLRREREDMGDMEGFRFSIEQFGLLEPIIVEPREDGKYCLVAGARRLEAFRKLGKTHIPAILTTQLTELERKELELEENLLQKRLTVVEEVRGIRTLHKLKEEHFRTNFPAKFGRGWSQKNTAETLDISTGKVSESIALAEFLDTHPDVPTNISRQELLKLARHAKQNYTVPDHSLYQQRVKEMFIHDPKNEAFQRLKSLAANSIITDLSRCTIDTLRILAPKVAYNGHCWFFHQLSDLSTLSEFLKSIKWNFLSDPHIWHIKGEDKLQFLTWASPAQGSPPKGVSQHISLRRDPNAIHASEKPYALYTLLITTSVERGGLVLDPASFGPTLARVCIDHQRNTISNCLDQDLWERGIINLETRK